MATFVNDLRLTELATGEGSGTWGETTNTNLELIAEAFSFGTEAITTNADTHTTTIADGSTDAGRSIFLKYTGTLDSACTITIGPNTVSKLWLIENATSGSQNIIIKQGSGATVTVPNGQTKAIYSDGAGSGGAMVDAFAHLNVVDLTVEDDLTITDDLSVGGTLGVTGVLTANAGVVVDNITIDGTEIDLSSGDLTIDVAGDIILDADGGDILLKDGGTQFGKIGKGGGSDLTIDASIADKDIFFTGTDGSSAITALTLDMSNAGAATFNSSVTSQAIIATNASGTPSTFNGADNNNTLQVFAGTTSNQSFGLLVDAGTSSSDYAAEFRKADNTTIMRIRGDGNVGIGVASPTFGSGSGLEIQQAGVTTLRLENSSDSNSFEMSATDAAVSLKGFNNFPMIFSTNNAEVARFDASGNFGLGTSSPAAPLSIEGSSTGEFDALILRNSNAASSGQSAAMIFEASSGTSGDEAASVAKISGLRTGSGATGDLLFHTTSSGTSSEALRLESNQDAAFSGNLNIPEKIIHSGDTDTFIRFAGANDIRIVAGDVEHAAFDGTIVFNQSGADMDFRVESDSNTNMLFVDAGNNRVGIGTGAPEEQFSVQDGSGGIIFLGRTSGSTTGLLGRIEMGNTDVDSAMGGIDFTQDGATNNSRIGFFTQTSGSAAAERARIDSDGNVGIGTTNPSRLLHLLAADSCLLQLQVGNTTGNCQILFGDSGSTTVGKVLYNHTGNIMSFEGAGQERMRISGAALLVGKTAANNGTAGVEASAAALNATVSGDTVSRLNRLSTDGEILRFQKDTASVGSIGNNTDFFIASADGTGLRFTSTQVLPCSESGATQNGSRHLGSSSSQFGDLFLAGTAQITEGSRPTDGKGGALIVGGNADSNGLTTNTRKIGLITCPSFDNTDGNMALITGDTNSATSNFIYIGSAYTGYTSPTDIIFNTGSVGTQGSEAMRISGGNVGIGTSSPNSYGGFTALTINGTNGGLLDFETNGTFVGEVFADSTSGLGLQSVGARYIKFVTNGAESFRIDGSQTMQIGKTNSSTTDAGHQIFTTGQHYYYSTATEVQRYYEITTGNQVGSISITTSATSFNTSSDQRLKDNIQDAADAGEIIDAIQVRSFDWKADGEHQRYGMVAQELTSVAPEAVSTPQDPDEMMGVDYSKLVPMLIKEIQTLRSRVAELEK